MLPEWVWSLRIFWASSVPYQVLRDGITDHIAEHVHKRNKEGVRQNLHPDYKLRLYRNVPLHIGVYKAAEFDGTCDFRHRPLSDSRNNTRILTLMPGTGTAIIQILLTETPIPSPQPYDALSYTWGSGSKYMIDCNGSRLAVQVNAWFALQALRHPIKELTFWVDAICIDQSNLTEREHQVFRMKEIYASAERVIVWLGPSFSDSHEAFVVLKKLADLFELECSTSVSPGPLDLESLSARDLPAPTTTVWKALDILFWREWYSRVWIMQEVAAGKNIVVRCGEDQCPLAVLEQGARYISTRQVNALTKVDPSRALRLCNLRLEHNQRSEADAGIPRQLPSTPCALLEDLLQARGNYSSDPRDKIFGVLGLSAHTGHGIVPDYGISCHVVYINVAMRLILQSKNLDMLSAVDDHRASLIQPALPSWVPDWDFHPRWKSFASLKMYSSMRATLSSEVNANRPLTTEAKDSCTTKLHLDGYIFDTILHVSDTFVEFSPIAGGDNSGHNSSGWHLNVPAARSAVVSTVDFFTQQRYRQWERLGLQQAAGAARPAGAAKPAGFLGEFASLDAFVKTITAGADLGEPPIARAKYHAWRKFWPFASMDDGKEIQKAQASLKADELVGAMEFLQAHHEAAFGRRFFTTTHGKMGIGPPLLRKGNAVVLLTGGRTPYILQGAKKYDAKLHSGSKTKHFQLVGECYVHGVMEGQLMPGQVPGSQKDNFTTITLV